MILFLYKELYEYDHLRFVILTSNASEWQTPVYRLINFTWEMSRSSEGLLEHLTSLKLVLMRKNTVILSINYHLAIRSIKECGRFELRFLVLCSCEQDALWRYMKEASFSSIKSYLAFFIWSSRNISCHLGHYPTVCCKICTTLIR